jgi:heat shock protein HslJ
MIRRLGYAAALAFMAAPMLMPSEAHAQRRQQMPSREELGTPQSAPVQQQQEKNFPLGASWTAVSLNGKPIADRRATLQVDANLRGTGFGGCNTFSAAAYPLRQQGFAVGPLALS